MTACRAGAALLLLIAPLLMAAEPLPTGQDAWLQRSLEVIGNPETVAKLPEPPASPSQQDLNEIANQARAIVLKEVQSGVEAQQGQKSEEEGTRIVIFTTLGKDGDPKGLRRLVEALDGEKQVMIVLRGLPVGVRRIDEAIKIMAAEGQGLSAPPSVFLDPELFEKYQVSDAPTILLEKNGKAVLWAKGVTDPTWLKRMANLGRTGDLGIHGYVDKVVEKSLLQEMRERISAINWDEKKKNATKKFMKQFPYRRLPVATKDRVFSFKPEIEVEEDIIGAKGKPIAKKGQKLNLLDSVQGRFFLIVFDATDHKQIKMAKQWKNEVQNKKRVKLIASYMDSSGNGWSEKERMEQELGDRIYFLNSNLVDAFNIEHVPSIIYAENKRVIVHEFSPRDIENDF